MTSAILFHNGKYAVNHIEFETNGKAEVGYEVVDMADMRVVFLSGFAARSFEFHREYWEHDTPSEDAVIEVLESYLQIGTVPVRYQ